VYAIENVNDVISDAFQPEKRPNVWKIDYKQFQTWQEFLRPHYSIVGRTDSDHEKLRFEDVAWFSCGETDGVLHPNQLWFKYTLSVNDPWKQIDVVRQNPEYGELVQLFDMPLTLNPIKAQTLADYRSFIPEKYRELYPPPDATKLAEAREVVKRKCEAKRKTK
jgi:hypothetical protein